MKTLSQYCVRIVLVTGMNILRLAAEEKRLKSPVLKKLQEFCQDRNTCPKKYQKDELKEKLTPLQYRVTQERGTERAFTGKYVKQNSEGVFVCIVCNNTLFTSDDKYDSSSGWPSFKDVVEQGRVALSEDTSHGVLRVEVQCAQCGAHLGHVFSDGPRPTGLRYCINSAALDFYKKDHSGEKKPRIK